MRLSLVTIVIAFVIGLWALLFSLRVLGRKEGENARYDEFFASYKTRIRIIGIGLLLLSVVFFLQRIYS